MAKRCTKCGNFMMDDERFCPNCGENAQTAVISPPPAPAPAPAPNYGQPQAGYQQPQQTSYQQPQNTYQQPYPATLAAARDEDIMTVGKWVGTLIVTTFFGLISIIFLFVWGFGDGPEARKRYCKAMLIVTAISIGIGILIWIVCFGIIAATAGSIIDEYNYNYNYSDWTSYGDQLAMFLSAMIH